jgi:branched-chain amino acid transport system permease protein
MLEHNLTSLMIVTLGFGYVVQGGAARIFGGEPRQLQSPLARGSIRVGDLWLSGQDLLVFAVTAILFALVWFVLERTRVGATVRAVAEDPKLAQLFGIDASLVYLGVFVFEAATVAFAATVVAPRSPILTSMGFDEVILTFVVVVLGGVGSVLGTLVASLGLGLFTAFFGALVSPAYTTAAAFAVVLAVLVLRPGGFAAK